MYCELCKILNVNTASEKYWLCPMAGLICETHCAEIQLEEVPDQLYLLYEGTILLCDSCCYSDYFHENP